MNRQDRNPIIVGALGIAAFVVYAFFSHGYNSSAGAQPYNNSTAAAQPDVTAVATATPPPMGANPQQASATPKPVVKHAAPKHVAIAKPHPVTLNADGGDNETTGTICDSVSSLKADSQDGSAPGCRLHPIGPVVFDKIVDHEQWGDTIMYIAAIHAPNNSWRGFVDANSLSGLPSNIITVAQAPSTPAAENNVTVFKLTEDVNAFHDMDRCQDLFHGMDDEGALARVHAAKDAGEYDGMSAGQEVVVTSGDLDKDIFVMVKESNNDAYGCVPSAKLKRL